jgi:O-antigen/teichoic acid export membrane protein
MSHHRRSGQPPQPGNGSAATPVAFNRWLELLLYAVGPIATLVTTPILAHGLGPAGRGQYGVAIAVATLAGAMGSWGQAEIFLSRWRSGTDHYRLHARISWFGGLLAGLLSILAMLVLDLPLSTALVTAVWVPVLTQVALWRAVSIARSQLTSPALDSALGSIFRVVALGTLALLALLSVDTALFTYQATWALGSLLTVGFATWRWRSRSRRGRVSVRPLLAGGIGIIAFNLLHAATLRADLIVLQLFSTPREVGVYAAPASLTAAALALSMAYRPRVQAAALSSAPLRAILRNFLHCALLATVGSAAVWLTTPLLVSILFGPQFAAAEPIMRILAFAIVPLLMVDLVFAALIVLGRQRALLLVAGGSALLNVGALCVMCPLWGATGAAFATVMSYVLATALGLAILVRTARSLGKADAIA